MIFFGQPKKIDSNELLCPWHGSSVQTGCVRKLRALFNIHSYFALIFSGALGIPSVRNNRGGDEGFLEINFVWNFYDFVA